MDTNFKIFKVNFLRHIQIGFDIIEFGLLVLLLIFGFIMSITHHQYILSFFALLVTLGLIYLLLPAIILHSQYYKLEKNRIIEYNKIEMTIIIFENGQSLKIFKKDIKKIIVYSFDYKNYSSKNLTTRYNYFTMILNNDKAIKISSLIAKYSKFKDIFDGILIENNFAKENYVNEDYL